MRQFCKIIGMSAVLMMTQSAFSQGYVVNAGRPDQLNQKEDEQKEQTSTSVVIRNPIMETPKTEEKKTTQIALAKPQVRTEAVHSFKSLAIDGRRSNPRVQFNMPKLPLQRVDEGYRVETTEKLLKGN